MICVVAEVKAAFFVRQSWLAHFLLLKKLALIVARQNEKSSPFYR